MGLLRRFREGVFAAAVVVVMGCFALAVIAGPNSAGSTPLIPTKEAPTPVPVFHPPATVTTEPTTTTTTTEATTTTTTAKPRHQPSTTATSSTPTPSPSPSEPTTSTTEAPPLIDPICLLDGLCLNLP